MIHVYAIYGFELCIANARTTLILLDFSKFRPDGIHWLRQCSNESVSQNIAVRLQFVSTLREEAGMMNLARPVNLIVFFAALLFVGAIVVGAF
jgi:hypothetical protein